MPRIFVSYSRQDGTFARDFIALLKTRYRGDFVIWFDEEIRGGVDWWATILHEISIADIFVFLVSNDALASKYCIAEFREALRLRKPNLCLLVKSTNLSIAPPDVRSELQKRHYLIIKNLFQDYTNVAAHIFDDLDYLLSGLEQPRPKLPPLSNIPVAEPTWDENTFKVLLSKLSWKWIATILIFPLFITVIGALVERGEIIPFENASPTPANLSTSIALGLTITAMFDGTSTATIQVPIIMTEIAQTAIARYTDTPTATPTLTPTQTPNATETWVMQLIEAQQATENAISLQYTQSAQLTANAPTNTPEPTNTPPPLPSTTPIPTATATIDLNATQTAEFVTTATGQAQATNAYISAQATHIAQSTASAIPKFVVDSDNVNIRSGPNTAFSFLTTARSGNSFPIIARAWDSDRSEYWYLVQYSNNRLGWISSAVGRVTSSGSRIPIAATVPPLPYTSTPHPFPQPVIENIQVDGTCIEHDFLISWRDPTGDAVSIRALNTSEGEIGKSISGRADTTRWARWSCPSGNCAPVSFVVVDRAGNRSNEWKADACP